MKAKKLLILSATAVAVLALSALSVRAADAPNIPADQKMPDPPTPDKVDGAIDCNSFFDIGNYQFDIFTQNPTAVPGASVAITGKITNSSDLPITNATAVAKVFAGNSLIDQFVIEKDLAIPAKGEKDVSFDVKIPTVAPGGDYSVRTYLIEANKFDLSGMINSDVISGGLADFTVSSDNKAAIQFDTTSLSADGQSYSVKSGVWVEKDKDSSIKIDVKNSTTEDATVPVTWKLYKSNSLDEKNLVDSQSQSLDIKAGKTGSAEYKFSDKQSAEYVLVAQTTYKDLQSIVNVPVQRMGMEQPQIGFVALSQFPVKANQGNTAYVCLNDSRTPFEYKDGQWASVLPKDNKLVMTLLDGQGKQIDSYTYTGEISPQQMGLKHDFTSQKDFDAATLKAELYSGDNLVDSVTLNYGQAQASQNQATSTPAQKTISTSGALKSILIVVIVALLVLSLSLIIIKKRM